MSHGFSHYSVTMTTADPTGSKLTLCLYEATITTASRKGGEKYCCLLSLTNYSRKVLGTGSSLYFQELGDFQQDKSQKNAFTNYKINMILIILWK